MADILFKTDEAVFSYRVSGILIHQDNVLLQKVPGDDGYALIGGHVAFGETTAEALKREFEEEIRVDINVERLLLVGENFFPWGDRPCHQICLYYLVSLADETQIQLDGAFRALDDLGGERIDLEMRWIPLKKIPILTIYPAPVKEHIIHVPDEIIHFVYTE